jgi:hypothetical protein
MIGWSLGVGEFVKTLCGRVKLGIVPIKTRMCANVVIIDPHVCVKKTSMKPQHIYASKILQMRKLVMY